MPVIIDETDGNKNEQQCKDARFERVHTSLSSVEAQEYMD